MEDNGKTIAIYHRVYSHETFETAIGHIHKCLVEAQKKWPNKPRHFLLDIDGHRQSDGAWDADMWELLFHVLMEGNYYKFFTTCYTPVAELKNTGSQVNEVPDEINIFQKGEAMPEGAPNLREVLADS